MDNDVLTIIKKWTEWVESDIHYLNIGRNEYIDCELFGKIIKEIYNYFAKTIKQQRAESGAVSLTLDECRLLCMVHRYSRIETANEEPAQVVADMVYDEIILSDKTHSEFRSEISKIYHGMQNRDIQVRYNIDTGDMSDVLKKCDEICYSVFEDF